MFTPQVIIQIILFFFVLVTIHEWGHFYFAKRAGILVREFAIGFGPKLFSFKKGETRYTLRVLPIGGFVRMAGEDPEVVEVEKGQTISVAVNNRKVTHLYTDRTGVQAGAVTGVVEEIDLERKLYVTLDVNGELQHYDVEPDAMLVSKGKPFQIAPWNRQFGSKTVGQRAMAIFAGPFMNFILAYVLFVAVVMMSGVATQVRIAEVEPGSPAAQSGLQANDVIVSVNSAEIGKNASAVIEQIHKSLNQPMNWVVNRDGSPVNVTVTPADVGGTPMVGAHLIADKRSATVPEALSNGWSNMLLFTEQILVGFKMLILGQFSWDDLGGPIRIVEVTGEQASAGLVQYTFWGAVMSLYLGIFNLLPFPALDGSRLVFLGLEALRGRPVDPNRESMVHFIGFAMLMLLMVAVTYNDILRLIHG